MNEIDVDVALEVASHEAIVREAYKDSREVWTWSVGLTNKSGHNVERYIDNPQPLEKCLAVWIWAMRKYAASVNEVLPDLKKHEFAAALSFHWNTGAIHRASWVRHVQRGNTSKAKQAFLQWKKPPEIIPRRKKERQLFFEGIWSNTGTMTEYDVRKPSHYPDWGSAKQIRVLRILKELLE